MLTTSVFKSWLCCSLAPAKAIHIHELSFQRLKTKDITTLLQCACED